MSFTFYLKWNTCFIAVVFLMLSGCASSRYTQDGPPRFSVNIKNIKEPVPKYEPKSPYGNPNSYVALGKRYHVLKSAKGYHQRGIASWYGRKFQGQLTSNREPYDLLKMTAASPVLPLPTYVRVTNLENGRSIIARVNDRGPFAPNRIIDLSYAAAKKLGYANIGTALVDVEVIDIRNPNAMPVVAIEKKPKLYLQVGAFSERNNAERLAAEVHTITQKQTRIRQLFRNNKPLYRVQVGPLIGVGESDQLQQALETRGLGPAITIIG